MRDYKDGKIYKIVCDNTGLTYYGSTCEKHLSRRLSRHRNNYSDYLKNPENNFCTSFKILEGGNYSIVLVEHYPCNSKEELLQRERFYIENNECVNRNIPTRTYKEYWDDNKERLLVLKKEYRQKNEDILKLKYKDYYQSNKLRIKQRREKYITDYNQKNKERISEKCKKYREENFSKIQDTQKEYYKNNCDKIRMKSKEYREKNIDKIRQYQKEYREKNKDKLNEYKKLVVNCECGSCIKKANLAEHLKSKKHIEFINNDLKKEIV